MSVYPRAAGFRDIGSSTMRYFPTIFAGKTLEKFYDASVLAQVSNTDYEGEIKKFGDTVVIRTTPDITINNYRRGQALVNQTPESTAVELDIDKGKYWSFVTEDVDDAQTDLKGYANEWSGDAAEQLKINIETGVFADIPSDVHASNAGQTAGVKSGGFDLGTDAAQETVGKDTVLDYIVDCGSVLDEQSIPGTNRFMILPVWMAGMLKKSDLQHANEMGDSKSVLRSGYIGMVDRFDIYVSNLLSTATNGTTYTNCLFGHKAALTFATQLVKSKMQDNPDGFGMLIRGLQVYGYEVVQPKCLGLLRATKG